MKIAYDNRIGGRALTSARVAGVAARGLTWLFPQLEGVRFDAAWSGPMDITNTSLPVLRELRPTAPCTPASGSPATASPRPSSAARSSPRSRSARTTAGAACPPSVRRARAPPPEPLRWPLVTSVTWAYEAGDRAREEGRPPAVVQRAIIASYGRYSAMNSATGTE